MSFQQSEHSIFIVPWFISKLTSKSMFTKQAP